MNPMIPIHVTNQVNHRRANEKHGLSFGWPKTWPFASPVAVLFASLIALGSSSLGGQSITSATSPSRNEFWKGFGIGFIGGYNDYKEPGAMREYGELYGLQLTFFTLNDTSTLAYSFECELVGGRLLYDGADVNLVTNVRTPKTVGTTDRIFNARGTVGLYRELTPAWAVIPYVGIGDRVLNDKTDGDGSYNRNVSYFYVPVGAQLAGWLSDRDSFSVAADLDLVLIGTVITKLSDVDPSNPDITNHNNGVGLRLETTYKHDFGGWALHIQPFYQKWKMGKSDEVAVTINVNGTLKPGALYEPENESDFVGLNIGADF